MNEKVLILSCFTGEGHNSAARAIREELTRRRVDSQIMDPVQFQSGRAQHFVSAFYNNMIRTVPRAFGALYKVGALYDSTGMRSPVYLANAHYAENLLRYIEKKEYTHVICTHLYGMEAMTAIHRRFSVDIPSYGVLTDYTRIPFLTEAELTGYCIPHEELTEQLTERGIARERIRATGIPVSARFAVPMTKAEARSKLNLPPDQKLLVVMSGGIGGGNVMGLCDALFEATDANTLLYIMVGHNEERKESIRERYGDSGRIQPIGFTPEVNVYMKAADVLLSKPGGLSSTEAAVANVPLIHVNGIPGCESENIRFFEQHGLSRAAGSVEEAAKLTVELLSSPDEAQRMIERQRAVIAPRAAEAIVDWVLEQ